MSSTNLQKYMGSNFASSIYCARLATNLRDQVQVGMLNLLDSKGGPIIVRILSPFVGLGAFLASLCLRIGSLLEPIFGLFVDVGAALIFLSPEPLFNLKNRCIVERMICKVTPGAFLVDLFKYGLVVGIGGIVDPRPAYIYLDKTTHMQHKQQHQIITNW
jgi:hypothetical protein